MEKKEEKKGFWASLFTPKSCSCCCGSEIEEVKEDAPKQVDVDKTKEEEESKNAPTCDCGGKC